MFLACAAWAAPASAKTSGHAATTGGASAPTASTVGAVTPTSATPTAPRVQYMGPITRSASTPSVVAPTTEVSCLPPGTTSAFSGSGTAGGATTSTVPCPSAGPGAATATG